MEIEIINTEIIDNSVEQREQISEFEYKEFRQPSEISVLISFEIDSKPYCLDFQTSTTMDYGAYSQSLSPYDGADDYDEIMELFDDDILKAKPLFDKIKAMAEAEKLWSEYVDEHYVLDDGYFGGMDATSEINQMVEKPK